MNDEKRWDVEKVKEETGKALKELALPGVISADEEPDLSYITQELIDSYWDDAQEKDDDLVESEIKAATADATAIANIACYWGNHWSNIARTRWGYINGHSGNGCDPATTAVLCGTAHRWRVSVRRLDYRYCRNQSGAKMCWR